MTARLIATGRELLSEIDGFMLARGVDVQELSLDRFANVAYWWLFKDVQDRESREKLSSRVVYARWVRGVKAAHFMRDALNSVNVRDYTG